MGRTLGAALVGLAAIVLVDCRPGSFPPVIHTYVARYPHPLTCAREANEPPCLTCLKASCCSEVAACDRQDEACGYRLDCRFADRVECEPREAMPDAASGPMNACKLAHCAAECAPTE